LATILELRDIVLKEFQVKLINNFDNLRSDSHKEYYKNVKGKKVRNLTFTGRVGYSKHNHIVMEAMCNCGNVFCQGTVWKKRNEILLKHHKNPRCPRGINLSEKAWGTMYKGRMVGKKSILKLTGKNKFVNRSIRKKTQIKKVRSMEVVCTCGKRKWIQPESIGNIASNYGCGTCCGTGLTVDQRLKKYVKRVGECIIYQGHPHKNREYKSKIPTIGLSDGRTVSVGKYILEQKLGRKTLDGMYACHKCGIPACINPDHIYEGTPKENSLDKVIHKTTNSLISYETALLIWLLSSNNIRHKFIHEITGASYGTISKIKSGETFRWLTGFEKLDNDKYEQYPVDFSKIKDQIKRAKSGKISGEYKHIINVSNRLIKLRNEYDATIELAKKLCAL